MQANWWQFWLPWQCSSTTWGTSPDRAYPGLHSKPLDASIGQVPAPYCPGAPMVKEFEWNTQNTTKTQLLASNTMVHFDRYLFVRISYPKTDPRLSSSMRQASFKCETLRLELKSSAKFLAIKCCQRTKFGKVIKLANSSSFKWPHICAHRG